MADFDLSLEIKTVGDAQALAKLDAVNAATRKSGAAHELTTTKAEGHRLALGKLGRALGNYAEQTTGANKVTSELAQALGAFAVGEAPMIAILGGVFAITKAYDVLTAHTREAKKAQEELIAKIAEAANAGNTDAIRGESRRLLFGQPFDKDGKLVANSQFAQGAFEGSLLDLQGKLKSLTDQFYATTNGFTQIAIQKQIVAVKAQLAPMEAMMAQLQQAANNVASQPADGSGQLPGITTTAQGAAGASSAADKAAADAAKSAAEAFGRGMKDRAAAMKQRVDETVALIVENGEIRKHMIDGMLPKKEDIDESIRQIGLQISDALEHDPILIRGKMLADLGQQLGRTISDGIAGAMVQALDAGFQEAFSGSGVIGFIEGFGKAMLGALGGVMEQMGATLISYGIAMELVSHAFENPITAGPALIAAGTLLVGLGAALQAVAKGGGAGHASAGGFSGGSGLPQIIDRGIIDPNSYSSRSPDSIPARVMSNDTYNFYGANDPQAVRWFDEMQKKRNQRGSLAGAGA